MQNQNWVESYGRRSLQKPPSGINLTLCVAIVVDENLSCLDFLSRGGRHQKRRSEFIQLIVGSEIGNEPTVVGDSPRFYRCICTKIHFRSIIPTGRLREVSRWNLAVFPQNSTSGSIRLTSAPFPLSHMTPRC